MVAPGLLFSVLLAGSSAVQASPSLLTRQSISFLSASQIAAYRPYTYYASAAYCKPTNTLAWNCGAQCQGNPSFQPVASGGDGAATRYWYVGYDPTLNSVIVAFEGADPSETLVRTTDDAFLTPLDAKLFPGISRSVKVDEGFQNDHARSASAVVAAVKTAMTKTNANKVTIVGHSLGGAIALLSSVYLPLNLPATTRFKTVTYAMPRVGNQAFADYVDAHTDLSHVNNRHDPIPTYPSQFLGYVHPKGEKHILETTEWVDCPGQDNTDRDCTIGYIPNIFEGNTNDNLGPYDGIFIQC